jgi:hypothetical protein
VIRTIILGLYGAALIVLAFRSLQAQRLRERYVILFTGIGLPFLLLAAWPNGIVVASQLLRIERPTLLVLLVAGFLILVVFELLSIVSVHERKISTLTQESAILQELLRRGGLLTGEPPVMPSGLGGTASDARGGRE